jgi:S-adenosylmethionine/arginine decarboxylase-like enzyme
MSGPVMASGPERHSVSVDGRVIDGAPLASPTELLELVYEVARIAKMEILHVMVADVKQDVKKLGREVFADEGGLSVLALISTSHIALHAWPLRRRVMFDMVSCRAFDPGAVREVVVQRLGVINA